MACDKLSRLSASPLNRSAMKAILKVLLYVGLSALSLYVVLVLAFWDGCAGSTTFPARKRHASISLGTGLTTSASSRCFSKTPASRRLTSMVMSMVQRIAQGMCRNIMTLSIGSAQKALSSEKMAR